MHKKLATFIFLDEHIQDQVWSEVETKLAHAKIADVEFVSISPLPSLATLSQVYYYDPSKSYEVKRIIVEAGGEWLVFLNVRNFLENFDFYIKELVYMRDGYAMMATPTKRGWAQRVGIRSFKGTTFVGFRKDFLANRPDSSIILQAHTLFTLLLKIDRLSALTFIENDSLYSLPATVLKNVNALWIRPYLHIVLRVIMSSIVNVKHRIGKLYVYIRELIDGWRAPKLTYDKNIPIFINCRDRVSTLHTLVTWLETEGLHNIIFVDNNSTYPPLLDYYAKTKYTVLRLRENIGQTAPWASGAISTYAASKPFIVTDPDVLPAENSHSAVKEFFTILNTHHRYKKVGFGLKIDDLPDHYELKHSVISWESQFWEREVAKDVYAADLDTTFALYRAGTPYILHPALRTGGKFVARHEPWYIDSRNLSEEIVYYRSHANRAVGTWGLDSDDHSELYTKHLERIRHTNKTVIVSPE